MVLEGAMTALVTPMRDGAVDCAALDALVEEQIAAGIDGLVAVGTTGESATLDMKEHIATIERVVETARGRVPVVAGAGANSTAEALELTRASKEVGADALLHVTPYYNKPTQDGLYRHFATIAEATDLPIILYNVPGRTACDLLPRTVQRLTEIPHIVAIKEATGDMRRASELIQLVGQRMAVLSGDDFTAMPLYALGGRGVISVVSNVMPAQMAAMWDAARAGQWDTARALHYRLLPLTELLFAESSPTPVKCALELLGKIGPELRLPMLPCSPALRAQLADWLRKEKLL
jgi:4-hydroxy-tetrahydrodipicolinate synthase